MDQSTQTAHQRLSDDSSSSAETEAGDEGRMPCERRQHRLASRERIDSLAGAGVAYPSPRGSRADERRIASRRLSLAL